MRGQSIPSGEVVAIAPRHVSIDSSPVHFLRSGCRTEEAIARNDTADLFQQILAVVVLHWRPQQQRERGQYFPIRPAFTCRLDRGAYGLNMALLVCPCAGFLKGGGG